MKIKFFKKENSFKKKDFAFNPNLYWRLALAGTFVVIIFALFSGYRLFMQINQEPALPTTSDSGQVPIVDQARIKKVLNFFSEREIKSNDILNSPAPVVDPSL